MRYMWDEEPHAGLHVGPSPVNGTRSACGKNQQNFSTGFSPEKTPLAPKLYLGELPLHRPYLGVRFVRQLHSARYLSTAKGTYPQKSASYPQSASLQDAYGGFPCPPNIGAVL